ncbi:T9SS type A sorting domain-containing protein [Chryseobacterium herbae]|uniref:T9SS type A sorting domain-containing protein n=1 Tax=Chryseobacterium herbae TaxID=2976476 RepID=A0ABT2J0B9_9FLAO|nr:T9SS type A sorting domain-containing protein [Chryseobacterium sp. pc1-10]MCT2564563.1 T9SS type A sorting domain-containing protein [Chryseobacterium sp. pc1-10]
MNKIFLLFLSLTGSFFYSQNYSGGAGTVGNPYRMATLEDLRYLSEHSSDWGDKYFLQTSDINATTSSTWNNTQGFNPIGNTSSSFSGTYDGGGYNITGLVVNRSAIMYGGMFGIVSTFGTLKNINLVGGSFYADMYVGSLAGETSGTVTNCSSSASVKAQKDAGGLIGVIKRGITNSHATGTVTSGYTSSAGGLAASAGGGMVSNCYATGQVNGGIAGGLIGGASSEIMSSYATGAVMGGSTVGGLVGITSKLVSNSYATGNVSGGTVGGLIGWTTSSVTKSHATGNVNASTFGSNSAGGLIAIIGHGTAASSFSSISLSFSTGTITGGSSVGGLVGFGIDRQKISIINCYSRSNTPQGSAGLVGYFEESGAFISTSYAAGQLGGNNPGGLIGYGLNVTFSKAYWDRQTTGTLIADASGWNTTDGGRTTLEMKNQNTFVNWDFSNIWSIDPLINDGYPYLKENSGHLATKESAKKDDFQIKIYPTIVKDIVYISSDFTVLKYSVLDLQGRLLKQGTSGSKDFSIDLTSLAQGAYLINLTHEKGATSKKIIKK